MADAIEVLAEINSLREKIEADTEAIRRLNRVLHDDCGLKDCEPGVYEHGGFLVTIDAGCSRLPEFRYKVTRRVALPVTLTLTHTPSKAESLAGV